MLIAKLPSFKSRLLTSLALFPAVLLLMVWGLALTPEVARYPTGLAWLGVITVSIAYAVSYFITLFVFLAKSQRLD
jgi:hypothetical protein